jgi:hypothetical protein
MDQLSINIFHCKTLQNLPKIGFWVRKQTIWQPCSKSLFAGVAAHFVDALSSFLGSLHC